MTTFSASRRSASLKSRPAMIGTPSAAKNPGETVRNRARGSSSPFGLRIALDRELRVGPNAPASRHGTTRADGDALDAGQLRDAAHRFLVERARSSCGVRPYVDDRHVAAPARCASRSRCCADCSANSVVSSMPAPASSTNDAAICVTANSAQPAVRARRDPHAAVRQARVAASTRSGRRAGAARTPAAPPPTSARPTPTHSRLASTVRSSARTEKRAA